jgi:hypothetical protein
MGSPYGSLPHFWGSDGLTTFRTRVHERVRPCLSAGGHLVCDRAVLRSLLPATVPFGQAFCPRAQHLRLVSVHGVYQQFVFLAIPSDPAPGRPDAGSHALPSRSARQLVLRDTLSRGLPTFGYPPAGPGRIAGAEPRVDYLHRASYKRDECRQTHVRLRVAREHPENGFAAARAYDPVRAAAATSAKARPFARASPSGAPWSGSPWGPSDSTSSGRSPSSTAVRRPSRALPGRAPPFACACPRHDWARTPVLSQGGSRPLPIALATAEARESTPSFV